MTKSSDKLNPEALGELYEALKPFADLAERFSDKREGLAHIEVFISELHAAEAACLKARNPS